MGRMGYVWSHEHGREHHHRAAYGIRCPEFDALRTRAEGRCGICGTREEETGGQRLVVDHYGLDEVFFVRGMICDKCNSAMAGADGRRVWYPRPGDIGRVRAYLGASWHRPTHYDLICMAANLVTYWHPGRRMAESLLDAYQPTLLF
jgi:hypothetical protein